MIILSPHELVTSNYIIRLKVIDQQGLLIRTKTEDSKR